MTTELNMEQFLPDDGLAGSLIGRIWLPASFTGSVAGPSPVLLNPQGVFDLSPIAPTTAELINRTSQRASVMLNRWHVLEVMKTSCETPCHQSAILKPPTFCRL